MDPNYKYQIIGSNEQVYWHENKRTIGACVQIVMVVLCISVMFYFMQPNLGESSRISCFDFNSNTTLLLKSPYAQTNNQIVEFTKGIVLAHHLNVSEVFLDDGFWNLLQNFDSKKFPPGCWTFSKQTTSNATYYITGSALFYENLNSLDLNNDGPTLNKSIWNDCPDTQSLLLTQGFLVPLKEIREKVQTWLEKTQVDDQSIGVHIRSNAYSINFKDQEFAKLRTNMNSSNLHKVLNSINESLDQKRLWVISSPDERQEPPAQSLFALSQYERTPMEWGVFGDMWLMSFVDIFIYNPSSTVDRTSFLWRRMNHPNGKFWPTGDMFEPSRTAEEITCKHITCCGSPFRNQEEINDRDI